MRNLHAQLRSMKCWTIGIWRVETIDLSSFMLQLIYLFFLVSQKINVEEWLSWKILQKQVPRVLLFWFLFILFPFFFFFKETNYLLFVDTECYWKIHDSRDQSMLCMNLCNFNFLCSSQARVGLLTIALVVTNILLTGLVWLSIQPKSINVLTAPHMLLTFLFKTHKLT